MIDEWKEESKKAKRNVEKERKIYIKGGNKLTSEECIFKGQYQYCVCENQQCKSGCGMIN